MSNLMGDQKVIDIVRINTPARQHQDTGIDIEGCSLYLLVLNDKVLGGKQSGEFALDVVKHGLVSYAPIIKPLVVARGQGVPDFEVS